MLREHRAIGEALDALARVARQERNPGIRRASEKIGLML